MKLPSLRAKGMPKVGGSITANENSLFDKNELPRWEAESVELYKPVIHKTFPGAYWWLGLNVWRRYTGVQIPKAIFPLTVGEQESIFLVNQQPALWASGMGVGFSIKSLEGGIKCRSGDGKTGSMWTACEKNGWRSCARR
jgi:hypothetical protein